MDYVSVQIFRMLPDIDKNSLDGQVHHKIILTTLLPSFQPFPLTFLPFHTSFPPSLPLSPSYPFLSLPSSIHARLSLTIKLDAFHPGACIVTYWLTCNVQGLWNADLRHVPCVSCVRYVVRVPKPPLGVVGTVASESCIVPAGSPYLSQA